MNNDILFCIFNFIPLKDTINFSLICKQFNAIANNSLYWNSLLFDHFNIKSSGRNTKNKYRQYYIVDNFLLKHIAKIQAEKLRECGLNYNILRIMSGMAGLCYSS